MKKQAFIYPVIVALTMATLFLTPGPDGLGAKPNAKTLVIIPFALNASKEMSYIRKGVSRMFFSRLSWPDNVLVIPQHEIHGTLSRLKGKTDNERINEIARETKSDFVLAGSITELAGSFSIDAKVFDIENKRFMAFFEQSDKGNDLIDKVDRIAAVINNEVFKRSTLTWDRIEQERQAKIIEMKRKNPEYMMQNPAWQNTKESHGWKIWKYLF